MIDYIVHIIAIPILLIASFIDFRSREVPDTLSYGLIFIGSAFSIAVSILSWDYHPLLYSLAGFIIFAAFGFLAYYTGQWGGGDAKLLMGLGILLGFPLNFQLDGFFISFFINLLFAGAVYGLLWIVYLIFANFKKFKEESSKFMAKRSMIIIRRVTLFFSFGLLAASLIISDIEFKIFFALLALFSFMSYFIGAYGKIVEKCCMIKTIPIEKLTEGDWIVHDIKIGGKKVCSAKDLGISKKQINILLNYKRKGKIKEIMIKEGIPFVPSFLLAYLFTMFFGNVLFLFAFF